MTRATYNFIRGMGSVLDLAPVARPHRVGRHLNLTRTDAEALRQDWQQVAHDFRTAFESTAQETGDNVQSK